MNRSDTYNTKQKDIIIEAIKRQKHAFTIKDLYQDLDKEVGLTTIYRLIDKLVAEKKLTKAISKDNITVYQCLVDCEKENHFYLKCDNCGDLIHVDCECIGNLSKHILKEHDFKANREQIIISGVCQKCNRKSGGGEK